MENGRRRKMENVVVVDYGKFAGLKNAKGVRKEN